MVLEMDVDFSVGAAEVGTRVGVGIGSIIIIILG